MIKVGFDVKYGHNEIEIPVNTGQTVYPDNGKGKSNLFSEAFTIINQIPTSQTNAAKVKWFKHTIKMCDRRDGIFDRSTGTMAYKANAWTVWCKDWTNYKPPTWEDGKGYYTVEDYEKEQYWTATVGDLVIFGEIEGVAPTTTAEFSAMVTKYKDRGGTITQAQSYINYKADGTPWATNHIEMIKS